MIRRGFRRSGSYTYRPRCDACHQCVAVRIPVEEFKPSRSQRRSWKQHYTLAVSLHALEDKPEYFDLYQRYQKTRHADGGMAHDDEEQFHRFLLQSPVETMLVEYRDAGILRMVSIVDVLDDGLSSVYTFYEPGLPKSSFGIFNVLWQIDLCRKLGLPFLYPGYWIAESRKMSYKSDFKPLQSLQGTVWRTMSIGNQS